MRTHPLTPFQPVGSVFVLDTLQPYFPWTEQWVINVSTGLTYVVGNFLTDVENILGSNPEFHFFRITEEPSRDEVYKRRLHIFLHAKTKLDVKRAALANAVQLAANAASAICFKCGDELESKDIYNESERLKYPFLPKPKDNEFNYRHVDVCMTCARLNWEEEQRALSFDGIAADLVEHEAENPAQADDQVNVTNVRTMMMFSNAQVNQLEKNTKEASKDHALRIKGLVRRMRESGPEKRLATIPENWRDAYCEDLFQKFPNFKEVIDFIRNQLALSEAGDGILRFPPFLLIGDPGIGKTEFMLTVANDFKTRLEVIDMACAQTGSALTGSESYWGNTQPGTLFDALVLGEVANPIIMLDEIDKASSDGRYKPLAGLHQLLEPRQAKRFHDLSVPEITLDASHVIWLATANSIETLEKPIIDRFSIFNIDTPSKDQMRMIATNQYQRFLDQHPSGWFFDEKIPQDVLAELCERHPRKVRKMLEQAFGLAAYDRRNYLTVQDIRASDKKEKYKRGIGFLSDEV